MNNRTDTHSDSLSYRSEIISEVPICAKDGQLFKIRRVTVRPPGLAWCRTRFDVSLEMRALERFGSLRAGRHQAGGNFISVLDVRPSSCSLRRLICWAIAPADGDAESNGCGSLSRRVEKRSITYTNSTPRPCKRTRSIQFYVVSGFSQELRSISLAKNHLPDPSALVAMCKSEHQKHERNEIQFRGRCAPRNSPIDGHILDPGEQRYLRR
jgi:hypothetical protein